MFALLFSLGMPESAYSTLFRALLYYALPVAAGLVLQALLRQRFPGPSVVAIYIWWPVPFFMWLLGTLWVESTHGPFTIAGMAGPALRGANTESIALAGLCVAAALVLHRITRGSPAIAQLSFWFAQLLAVAAATYGATHHLGAPLR